MELPKNINLPFFTYGLFKPNELGYYRIKDYVKNSEVRKIKGQILIRDGIPLFKKSHHDSDFVKGYLLFFEFPFKAYTKIVEIEPGEHYEWKEITIDNETFNILIGKKMNKGNPKLLENRKGYFEWEGKNDPLFKEAIDLITEKLKNLNNQSEQFSYKSFFELQMLYMLLWSSIERFITLKYTISPNQLTKSILEKLSNNIYYEEGLKKYNKEGLKIRNRELYSSRNLENKKFSDVNLKKSVDHFYTLRSNIVHRGKSLSNDFNLVYKRTVLLLNIFKYILDNEFKENTNAV